MAGAHEQTLAHVRLLAGVPGYWELRALHRAAGHLMTRMAGQGAELFVGVNGRSMGARSRLPAWPRPRSGANQFAVRLGFAGFGHA
jgi:hypothetical protein